MASTFAGHSGTVSRLKTGNGRKPGYAVDFARGARHRARKMKRDKDPLAQPAEFREERLEMVV